MKLIVQAKSIADFQMRVVSWKGSLALVLGIAVLQEVPALTKTEF
jgi:hypothetical protein